jgi:hypothetical protein
MSKELDDATAATREAAVHLAAAKATHDQCKRAMELASDQLEEAKGVLKTAENRVLNALHVEATGKDRERFL